MNSFGNHFRLTCFGESHGAAVGGVIDGMEPGIAIDLDAVQHELDRRRPGQSSVTTARDEKDRVEILSGMFEGKTTGTPIGFIVRNTNQHSGDYDNLRNIFRPSHADYTYQVKYGIRDHRGGGRSSARETISRVVAGAFARQGLALRGISISAYASQIGAIELVAPYSELDLSLTETNAVRCPDPQVAERMLQLVKEVKSQGDTVGGVVTCIVRGVPAGLGDPVFDKLHARLAFGMMSINAAKGFEYGMGFAGAAKRGTEVIDNWVPGEDAMHPRALSNHSGGIQGGISNGEDIYFRVAFKPVATLLRDVATVDMQGNPAIVHARGRHDPCVIPRAVPIVEAMAAMTIYDSLLESI